MKPLTRKAQSVERRLLKKVRQRLGYAVQALEDLENGPLGDLSTDLSGYRHSLRSIATMECPSLRLVIRQLNQVIRDKM